MNIYQRAFIAVDRNLKKSLVLFLLLFIISNLIIASLLVIQAVNETVDHFYTNMPNQIPISVRPENDECEDCYLSLKQLTEIESLPYVRQASFGLHATLGSRELVYPVSPGFVGTAETCLDMTGRCLFRFNGVSGLQMLEIEENQLQLVEGRFFEESELIDGSPVVLISTYFAEFNDLQVGDMIIFERGVYGNDPHASPMALNIRYYHQESPYVITPIPFMYRWYAYNVELEIIGLYALGMDVSPERRDSVRDPLYSTLYSPNQFVDNFLAEQQRIFRMFYSDEELVELGLPSRDLMWASFTLHDFRDYDLFYNAAINILGELYEEYHVMIGTIEHMGIGSLSHSMSEIEGILTLFLQLTVLACFVVIGLVITLFFRDRRFEMGIYLSLGVKKFQVIKQLFLETIYIILPAYGLSLLTGSILANRLNDFLMIQYLILPETDPFILLLDNIRHYSNEISYDMVRAFHQVVLNIPNILLITGVLFLTLFITMLVPAFSLLKYSPLILLGKNKE